jgi:hypothetical protein
MVDQKMQVFAYLMQGMGDGCVVGLHQLTTINF